MVVITFFENIFFWIGRAYLVNNRLVGPEIYAFVILKFKY